MGFKVIETDEEFESALTAGLLWINTSALWPRPIQWPRPISSWRRCGSYEHHHIRRKWEEAKGNKAARKDMYLPEDFAVLVEDDGSLIEDDE